MRRPLRWITAVAAATGFALNVPAAAEAACATAVPGTVGTTTTFTHCAGEQSYDPPAGVNKVRVKLIGAAGGNRNGRRGFGGQVDSIINIPVATRLYVLVGGTGDGDSFNGGGRSTQFNDTHGGGASDIRTTSCGFGCPGAPGSGTLASRFVVAGGGGGAGACGANGGHGGGQPNGDGNDAGPCFEQTEVAKGGTQTAGGHIGGVQGKGADGDFNGGGGGGLYGGGTMTGTSAGAGGSSYGPAGTTFSVSMAAAQVQITPYVPTSTSIGAAPASTKYGESVTFTATISYAGQAGGTVQFYEGGTPLGTPRPVGPDNKATLTTSALTAGSRSIQAFYSGGTGSEGSMSGYLPYTVTKQATQTVTDSSAVPTKYGEQVTFTATVTPKAGTQPLDAGSVQFYLDGDPFDSPVAIDPATGTAELTTSALSVGGHVLSSRWLASANYAATDPADAAGLAHLVEKADTTTSIASTGSPSGLDEDVTFTAMVAPGTGTLDGGTVQFFDGATPLGSPAPVDTATGEAELTTASLAPGAHSITASFLGTSSFAGSTSAGLAHTVDKGITGVTITSDAAPAAYGQAVVFTATVAPQVGALDGGSVQFSDGTDPLGAPVPVDTATGKATLTVSSLVPGSHAITAVYDGTATYAASASPVFTQEVEKGAAGVTVTSSLNPSATGQAVTFTATVVPKVGALDGGTVQFFDGSAELGAPATVDAATGKATLSSSALAAGAHAVSAKFSGTPTYAAATSAALTQTVNAPPAAPSLALDGRAASKRAQLLLNKKAITIRVSCGAVTCTVDASGEVRDGRRTFGKLAAPGPREVPAGASAVIALRSSAALRRRVRSYQRAHPRRRAKMVIAATFTTPAETLRRTITIRVRTLK